MIIYILTGHKCYSYVGHETVYGKQDTYVMKTKNVYLY